MFPLPRGAHVSAPRGEQVTVKFMRNKPIIGILSLLLVFLVCLGCEKRGQGLRLGGGPSGGTFVVTAQALAQILEKNIDGLRISVERSGGSLANLRGIEENRLDMALVYGADLHRAVNPLEASELLPAWRHARVLARLYPAAAQLVVRRDSRIKLPSQLRGTRVGVGSPGSGAAQVAQRYFGALGLWDQITPVYIGYDAAMAELMRGNLTAVWEMVGVPSPSLTRVSQKVPLRMLNLRASAEDSNFFDTHPFYQPFDIPPYTYPQQEHAIKTFGDSAFLVVGDYFPAADAARILKVLLSENGIEGLRAAHPALKNFSPGQAHEQPPVPLHEGSRELLDSQSPHQVTPSSL